MGNFTAALPARLPHLVTARVTPERTFQCPCQTHAHRRANKSTELRKRPVNVHCSLRPRVATRLPRASRRSARTRCAAAPEEPEVELAVFRFTLGLPFLPDEQIPTAIGTLGLGLIATNRFLAAAPPDSQIISEFVGAVLAAACMCIPSLHKRITVAKTGISGSGELAAAGGRQVFAFDKSLDERSQRELAWASFALFKNTETRALLVVTPSGEVQCARGSLGGLPAASESAPDPLLTLTAALQRACSSPLLADLRTATTAAPQLYLDSASRLAAAGASEWDFLPTGAESLLAVPILAESGSEGHAGLLIMLSDGPYAFPPRERKWARAISTKLSGIVCEV